MLRTVFDVRRELSPVLGLPRNLDRSRVRDPAFAELVGTREVEEALVNDPVPIPHPEDREGYFGEHHLDYWMSGREDFRKILPYIQKTQGPHRYLDFGGATGRVLRHARQTPNLECWLVDINVNWIDWVTKHFPNDTKAFQGRVNPSIPIEDNYFSAISAFSVFTHFDTEEIAWLLELTRILQPGGYLYLTTVDEHVWAKLDDPDWKWLRDSVARGQNEREFAELIKRPFPGDRFVWKYSDAETYNVNTFLRSTYIDRVWGRFLDVVDYQPFGHLSQTVVVLQKRKSSSNK